MSIQLNSPVNLSPQNIKSIVIRKVLFNLCEFFTLKYALYMDFHSSSFLKFHGALEAS